MNALIIADDSYVKTSVRTALGRFDSACTIFEVSSPEEALRLMRSVSMSVVFSEVNMRHMNGLSFAEAHKSFFSGLCWIVISEFESFYDIQKAINLGARDYLLKPVDESGIRDLLKYGLLQNAGAYRQRCNPCVSCR
ncbi:response regulator transcription factor [Saccharibacillus alkalitolerans]|uniref:Response regulator n=1 Tax=Saccharibacillus alkalitolerans TaxID=2705290 RepID=A0ABX0FBX9_9BACL|nr:response regulator [Saccharibacillus alkalitolerans]NGZ77788.1 response regulator [Saccharibacillus alkalitolerans]